MKRERLWSVSVLAGMAAGLVMIGSLVVFVDPFFQYHKPLNRFAYTIGNQSYQNPGIVKNFTYDAVISGSSMTENFKPTWFKEIMGLNAIKVSYSGARSKNLNIIFEMALKRNPNIKKVFWGLDIYALESPASETRNPLPLYLYDNNFFNDVSYVLNKEVLTGSVKDTLRKTQAGGATTTMDEAYFWESAYTFSESTVLANYVPPDKAEEVPPIDQSLSVVKANLEDNIIPLVEAYPDTEFNLFFPPYSILYWQSLMQQNQLEKTLYELDYAISHLVEYPNVKLFYFQNEAEIATNLYRYKDYTHYDSRVNRWMVECFQNSTHLLTKETYSDELERMRLLTTDFDYGLFWGDTVPLKGETILTSYLEALNNPRYLVFLSAKDEASSGLSVEVREALKALGLQKDLEGKYRWSYIGIINGGNVTYEALTSSALSYISQLEGLDVEVVSQGMDAGNLASVCLNGVEYAKNGRGLNLVVYDKIHRRVVDSVCFDTYEGTQTASR